MPINSDKPHRTKSKNKADGLQEDKSAYTVGMRAPREEERLIAQEHADSLKSAEDRNKQGQYSTPYPLALQMVAQALSYLPGHSPLTFLEPSVGTGVFFSALIRIADRSRILSAVGCEIDDAYGHFANTLWAVDGLNYVNDDFIAFAEDERNHGRFNFLCTNPPYVRHHHLRPDYKIRLQSLIASRLHVQPSGLSGLYVYFVLMADALLAEGAVASWLLPAEFLYVNYGKVLRDYLTTRVTLLSIHHFNPDEVQFDDALVSSCIVTYRKPPHLATPRAK